MRTTRTGFLAGTALVVILAALMVESAETLAKGHLLAYADEVRHVRVFGRFDFYTALESSISLSIFTAAFLASSAAVGLLAATVLRRGTARSERPQRFFLMAGVGAAYLSLDEVLGIHETVGVNLGFLLNLPGHPDDVLVAALGFAGVCIVAVFRDVVGPSRRAMTLFAVTAGLFALAALGDFSGYAIEEWAEVAASAALLGGCAVLAVHHLTGAGVTADDQRVEDVRSYEGQGDIPDRVASTSATATSGTRSTPRRPSRTKVIPPVDFLSRLMRVTRSPGSRPAGRSSGSS